ncbi:heavy metal translocating P-type ATPase [Corynebacterium vitaeruminis]|uniref:heavy metal translocating P-type ATPase n=1 Tax=Corynebacterium vitaeruminis TaxID=38305 RepID=UPI0009DE4DFC|nr:HAD family hydrolase [Corynebacterium vitaeruminis]
MPETPDLPSAPRALDGSDQKELDEVIVSAKNAAAKAGIDTGTMRAITGFRRKPAADEDDSSAPEGKTSFAFELKNLPSASSIEEVENAVNELDDVDVRIVYPSALAWVTAGRSVDPTTIQDVFARFGITATLTDSSLRRRLAWSDVEERRYGRSERRHFRRSRAHGISARLRKQLEDDERANEQARQSGFMDKGRVVHKTPTAPSDVLFTARSLLTRSRFIVSFLLSIPVLLISFYPSLQFDYWQWVLMLVSMPVVFYGAWPFHRATLGGLRRKMSALDSASSAAVLLAWFWSVAMIVFTSVGDPTYRANPQWVFVDPTRFKDGALFFDVACGMTVLLVGGRLFSRKTRASYLDVLDRYRLDPTSLVTVVRKNRKTGEVKKEDKAIQKLNVGDDVIVGPGEIIPVDGSVIGGSSQIDATALGISPYTAKVHSKVYAGCINETKTLKIRVHNTGHRTWLAAIYRWVESAAVHQNVSDALATKTASMLVPISMIVAACDFALWALLTNNPNQAFATALAVLGCVAPVALAMSASLATRQGIEAAAKRGVLINEGEDVRALDEIETVIFNRVGTLSEGEMSVETVTADRGENPELVIRVAGAVALESDHPVSRALIRAARESRDQSADKSIPSWIEASHFRFDEDGNFHAMVELPITNGNGETEVRSVEALLWRPRNLAQLDGRLAAAAVSGGTPIVVRWKGKDRGVITLYDHAKDDANEAVDELESMGIETMMLSRDTYPVARRYGDYVGVSHVLAGIQPGDKPQTVRSVRSHGVNVALVGDTSVNECFRVANLGILIGAMQSIENPSALDHPKWDIVLLEGNVAPIPWLFRFGRKLSRLVRNNMSFAWAYNGIAVALACAGLLHPMIATVAMLASSLIIELRSKMASTY